jgi:hypothetical protein
MAMSIEFIGGKISHLIMDWRTFGARVNIPLDNFYTSMLI